MLNLIQNNKIILDYITNLLLDSHSDNSSNYISNDIKDIISRNLSKSSLQKIFENYKDKKTTLIKNYIGHFLSNKNVCDYLINEEKIFTKGDTFNYIHCKLLIIYYFKTNPMALQQELDNYLYFLNLSMKCNKNDHLFDIQERLLLVSINPDIKNKIPNFIDDNEIINNYEIHKTIAQNEILYNIYKNIISENIYMIFKSSDWIKYINNISEMNITEQQRKNIIDNKKNNILNKLTIDDWEEIFKNPKNKWTIDLFLFYIQKNNISKIPDNIIKRLFLLNQDILNILKSNNNYVHIFNNISNNTINMINNIINNNFLKNNLFDLNNIIDLTSLKDECDDIFSVFLYKLKELFVPINNLNNNLINVKIDKTHDINLNFKNIEKIINNAINNKTTQNELVEKFNIKFIIETLNEINNKSIKYKYDKEILSNLLFYLLSVYLLFDYNYSNYTKDDLNKGDIQKNKEQSKIEKDFIQFKGELSLDIAKDFWKFMFKKFPDKTQQIWNIINYYENIFFLETMKIENWIEVLMSNSTPELLNLIQNNKNIFILFDYQNWEDILSNSKCSDDFINLFVEMLNNDITLEKEFNRKQKKIINNIFNSHSEYKYDLTDQNNDIYLFNKIINNNLKLYFKLKDKIFFFDNLPIETWIDFLSKYPMLVDILKDIIIFKKEYKINKDNFPSITKTNQNYLNMTDFEISEGLINIINFIDLYKIAMESIEYYGNVNSKIIINNNNMITLEFINFLSFLKNTHPNNENNPSKILFDNYRTIIDKTITEKTENEKQEKKKQRNI